MERMLACANFSFPLLPLDAALDLIATLGFDGVDVGLFAGSSHTDPGELLRDLRGSAADLLSRVQDRGLVVADMFLSPGQDFETLAPNHPDPGERQKSREVFLQALEFTLRTQARHLSALPGIAFPDETREDSLARGAEELAWRAEEAARAGVPFAVEPHIGSIIPTPAEALELVKRAAGLTLTLDYGHFVSEGIPEDEIEPLIEHASHFHARCACRDRLQCSLEQNTIDFGRVLEVMERDAFEGAIGVEYVWIEWRRCNEVDNLSETIRLRELIRQHLERLTEKE